MNLKDVLTKRPQPAPEAVLNQPQPSPSLNNHIKPYADPSRPVSTSEPEKRAFVTRQAERVVTIGENVILKGNISDCDKAEIQGKFEGTINANSIYVAENGIIKGDIECDELSVSGSVEGKVISRKTLDIASSGKVVGEIAYEKLLVTSGGIVLGTLENQTDKPQNPDIG
jgi:cytoskeletal protein CcmA (bactofilin family)